MLSALKRCARGYSSGLRVIQGNGVIVERSVMSSISIRSLAGAGTGRAGKAAFELLDEDIEEKFVKGSGPGGQKINKVRNCVQLTHVPTGVTVSCQDSRELHANRHIARKRLKEKVEFQLKGEDSKVGRRINKIRNKKVRSQRKSRLKHQQVTTTAGTASGAASKTKQASDARDELEELARRMMMSDGDSSSGGDESGAEDSAGEGGGGSESEEDSDSNREEAER